VKPTITPLGRADYDHWQTTDRKALKRVNRLVDDTHRDPYEGIRKPEPLKHALAGDWSATGRRKRRGLHSESPRVHAHGARRRRAGKGGKRGFSTYASATVEQLQRDLLEELLQEKETEVGPPAAETRECATEIFREAKDMAANEHAAYVGEKSATPE